MSMIFCDECQSMMVPKEDQQNLRLVYVCTSDPTHEVNEAKSNIVYETHLSDTTTADYHATQIGREVVHDPCMPRTKEVACPKCSMQEACYFTPSDENMKLRFVCCNLDCAHVWWGATSA